MRFKATNDMTAALTAKLLFEFFCLYGIPEEMLTDQGANFCSNLTDEITNSLKIKKLTCSPYHPQTNGSVERLNATINQQLPCQSNANHDNWDELIHYVIFTNNNTSVNPSTTYTPYELMYGCLPRIPFLENEEQFPNYTE